MHHPIGFGNRRLLVVAFEGWNDAGEAASTTARLIAERLDLIEVAAVDPELYYDYQFNRPTIVNGEDGTRHLEWPGAALLGPSGELPQHPESVTGPYSEGVHVLIGAEPARSWRAFAAELIDAALAADVEGIMFLGAMLADAPHTRPLMVFSSSENADVRDAVGVDRPAYEGPVGVLTVLADHAERVGIPTMSLWVSVPHYVHNAPSPKAVIALLDRFEELTGLSVPRGTLEADAKAWEAGVDALASEDEDMAGYVAQLEQARDAVDAPEASGDAIALEFEKYLRRRGDGRADGRADGRGGDEPWRPRDS
ncbi:proteasome assembly chaperone family protein [Agromyces aerolatus]|uniref:proteasome assembly chaperone family protein n=1 Tax=Agromyces sp. LY-1074 TaxID=3074080 RepID=UPI00285E3D8C|nr:MULTISPECIES: PAC2 family protein [unclassified Agromyces]MDR5700087.1 PAC2 family protein [Agromyces sp. LY-1074]MDR5706545.1 PAC2 family protein [Agromyces sp. LY-1358]